MAIFCSRLWLSRAFPSLSSNPLHMLKAHQEAEVDILDRMPNLVGLVVLVLLLIIWKLRKIATDCDELIYPELRGVYHVVVFAYGAESDRVFGVPGE
ncbi:NADPH:adrenodoxin oxidoreductase mitochondrial, partial [Bienertia sinuspersici]